MPLQRLRSPITRVATAISGSAVQVVASGARPTRAALLWGAWLGALAMLAPDAAQAQQGPFTYVPNFDDGTVSVIDTSTNAVSPTTIPVGLSAVAAAVRGDESLVYVTNSGHTVSVIDTATNTTVATIPVGIDPRLIAVSADGTRAYVANRLSDTVSVINTATNSVTATIAIAPGAQPVGVGVTPDGSRVYVTNFNANTVSVINTATNTVIATIAVGNQPSAVTVTPDGTRAYVSNLNGFFNGTVSVINTATNAVIDTIPLGAVLAGPQILAVSPNGSRVYVANNSDSNVFVIDTATNAKIATITVGTFPIGVIVTPDGTRVYVTNNFGNTVSVIDTGTNTVIATLPVGVSPFALGICSNGNALLAAGLTFKANTSGALNCTLASGPTGSPGPIFTGGTLQIAGANVVSALPITLQAAGGIIDTNGNNARLSGPISGPGGLTKIGAGTLTLSGSSTYTGATSVNAGTLQAGAVNAFSPFSAVTIAGGATLDLASFNQSIGSLAGAGSVTLGSATLTTGNDNTSTTFSGTISGTGGLTKVGTGTLLLNGDNGYQGGTSLNAGTLAVGSDTALGTGMLAFASGTTLQAAANGLALANAMTLNGTDTVDTQLNTLTLSGVISGTGGLAKVGTGTLLLTGASTYAGPTNINAGILNVNGSLLSTAFVNSGGTLMGNGTIGGLVVNGGGTVAPGNSIGTLNVAGNVSFTPGSVYQVEVNQAGQSDKIAASGTATLTGGTVQVLGTLAPNHTYTILTAQGGVSGTFSNLLAASGANFVFLSPQLSYTPTSVLLGLAQTVAFTSVAATPNQASVAAALGTLPAGSSLLQAVLTQTSVAGAQQAFNALSGEVHASAQTVMLDDSRYVRQAVWGRLRQSSYGSGPMAALGVGGPILAYADPDATDMDGVLAYAGTKRSAFPVKAPPLAPPVESPDLTFWAQGVGAWGKIDGDGNAADASRNLGGFFTGFDRRFGDWRLGLAGGYTNSSVSVSTRASSANIDTAHLAAYAGASFGQWNFRSGAAFAWNTVSTSRSVIFPGFGEQTAVHYGAGEAQIFGELGYGMALGAVAAEPFAGLAWVHLNTDSFNEAGGVSALTGSGNTDDVGYSTLGLRAATLYLLQNGMALIPRASAAWQHAFGALTPAAALAFQGGGAPFSIAGVPLARDAALVEAGLDLQITVQARVGVSYAGQLASSAHDNAVKGNFTWKF
jgi:outer membrane autotransporter protein